ncbi:hypothetical protein GCM10009827_005570 [Dactylosporangium maewongense]|uniref:Knr4/Smi1-like domain-containing protein n=1 Tax=Dactylosporangium maewongense TaxID=634393 RepID=A0ABN1ZK29_9ACTN
MRFADFDVLLRQALRRYAALERDGDVAVFDHWRATEADLVRVQRRLGVRLPEQYRGFLLRYGAGRFLFVELLPADEGRRWVETLVGANEPVDEHGSGFVAVAPVGTGDYWGFVVRDGICEDAVSFRYHEDGAVEPAADDFLEFVAAEGLRVGR